MEERQRYTREFKEAVVRKIMTRGDRTIAAICEQEGVLKTTANNWLTISSKVGGSMHKKTPRRWSAEEKLRILGEVHALEGEALGSYLRAKGLHSPLVEEWRGESLAGLGKPAGRDGRDGRIRDLEHEVAALGRDVARKDKALAEASTLLILKKKVDVIWGRYDEEKK